MTRVFRVGPRVLRLLAPLLLTAGLGARTALAGTSISDVSIGSGLRSSFTHSTPTSANDFTLNAMQLRVNGSVDPYIKFTFDTDYKNDPGAPDNNTVQVIDAIGRFEYSRTLNFWFGRFLPPSDRANSYGMFYASNWAVFTDGVQDDYPTTVEGRADGAAYWGQFGIVKVQAGAFDVPLTQGTSEVVSAARVTLDFWDPEPGYYLNGTYYGEKNILALGIAGQSSASRHAYNFDLLIERHFRGLGTLSLESEYASNQRLGAYGSVAAVDPATQASCAGGCFATNHGYYVLLGYLTPTPIGVGNVQVLGKFGSARYAEPGADIASLPQGYLQHTTEFDLNYILKGFNARVGLFYINQARSALLGDIRAVGLDLQLQI